MQERVLIFDFGAQYVQLIARRVREQNVFCQIVRHDLPASRVAEVQPKGLILSGGPASVYEPNAPHCDPAIFDRTDRIIDGNPYRWASQFPDSSTKENDRVGDLFREFHATRCRLRFEGSAHVERVRKTGSHVGRLPVWSGLVEGL